MLKFCDENFFVLFHLIFSFETMWIWMWTFLSKFCLLIFTGVNLFSKIFRKITVCFQLGSRSGSGEIFEIRVRVRPKWIRVRVLIRVNIGSGRSLPSMQGSTGSGSTYPAPDPMWKNTLFIRKISENKSTPGNKCKTNLLRTKKRKFRIMHKIRRGPCTFRRGA